MKIKNKVLTKRQLDILYDCWKEGNNTKDRLTLIENRMPKVSTLTALKVMRHMAKTDTKWIKWATRQKNIKEKYKLEKKKEIETKKIEREKRNKERKEKKFYKNEKEYISKNIDTLLSKELEDYIPIGFFFCPITHQYVTNISCIFRIFGGDFSFGSSCDRCNKMDKYITILKEFINERSSRSIKRQRSKGNTSSKRGCKVKKSLSCEVKETERKSCNTECKTTSRHTSRKS